MAFNRVQGNSGNSAGSLTLAVTLSATSAGNLVIGIVSFDSASGETVTSVTDNAAGGSSTYTAETEINDTTNNEGTVAFHCANVKAGVTSVTIHFSPAPIVATAIVEEFSGNLVQNDGRDGAAHGGQLQPSPGTGTDGISSGTFTTTTNGDLIWGGTGNNSGAGAASAGTGFTAGTRFTGTGSNADLDTEFLTQTTAGSGTAATFTQAANSRRTTFMLAIKPFVSLTPVPPQPEWPYGKEPVFPPSGRTWVGMPMQQQVLPRPQLMGQMVM
jgi:hypothetical protein